MNAHQRGCPGPGGNGITVSAMAAKVSDGAMAFRGSASERTASRIVSGGRVNARPLGSRSQKSAASDVES